MYKNIRFIYPVYIHPTHGRFYYLLCCECDKHENFMNQPSTHNHACRSNRSWFVYACSGACGLLLVARCSVDCPPSLGARGYRQMLTCGSLQWVFQCYEYQQTDWRGPSASRSIDHSAHTDMVHQPLLCVRTSDLKSRQLIIGMSAKRKMSVV